MLFPVITTIILARHLLSQVEAMVPDAATVNSLVDMGFALEACRKAAFHTNNAGKQKV
jgi:uncharacterized UBP type Zn finger protein